MIDDNDGDDERNYDDDHDDNDDTNNTTTVHHKHDDADNDDDDTDDADDGVGDSDGHDDDDADDNGQDAYDGYYWFRSHFCSSSATQAVASRPRAILVGMDGQQRVLTKRAIATVLVDEFDLTPHTATRILKLIPEMATAELKTVGKFTFPGVCTIHYKWVKEPKAWPELLGYPRSTIRVVKAFPVKALRVACGS